MPGPTPEQQQAFARMIQYGDKLFQALEDLEAVGGLRGLSGRIKPGSIAKAATALRSVNKAIEEQLAGLKGLKPKTQPQPPPAVSATTLRPAPDPSSLADAVPIRRSRR